MKTYIDIRDLRLYAPIGVAEQERRVGALFAVDLRIYCNAAAAMESDDLADAVNYAEITAAVTEAMAQPVQLLEHAARNVMTAVTSRFPAITAGRLTVTKLHPPIPAPTPLVSFTVEW